MLASQSGNRSDGMHVRSGAGWAPIALITCAGHQVDPVAVEHRLMEHWAVLESVVVGMPDALRGECVKAFVVLKPGAHADERLESELARFVEAGLSLHASPRQVEFIESLPRSAAGEIERAGLHPGTPKGVL